MIMFTVSYIKLVFLVWSPNHESTNFSVRKIILFCIIIIKYMKTKHIETINL